MSQRRARVLRVDCVTLFPEMFAAVTDLRHHPAGLERRALGVAKGLESPGFRRKHLAPGG